jgi:hypothetical protein
MAGGSILSGLVESWPKASPALHLHTPLLRRLPVHRRRQRPGETAGTAPAGKGREVHAFAPARPPGLEEESPHLEPGPPGGASDQGTHAHAERGAAIGRGRANPPRREERSVLRTPTGVASAHGSGERVENASRPKTRGVCFPAPHEERTTLTCSRLAGWTGLEPATSDVTGRRSNRAELPPRCRWKPRARGIAESWWAVQGSNLWPSVCKTDALPLS